MVAIRGRRASDTLAAGATAYQTLLTISSVECPLCIASVHVCATHLLYFSVLPASRCLTYGVIFVLVFPPCLVYNALVRHL